VVDEDRVRSLLRNVTQNLRHLAQEVSAPEDRRSEPIWIAGVKYWLVTAIESCVDVAQHIDGSEKWRTPSDNGDAMRVLAENGVLDRALGERMRRAVGFRNVVVHEYTRVDDQIVLERLADPSDLEMFVRAVNAWLESVSD